MLKSVLTNCIRSGCLRLERLLSMRDRRPRQTASDSYLEIQPKPLLWKISMARILKTLVVAAGLLAICHSHANAQGLSSLLTNGKGKSTAPADAAADPLRRTTPRDSIYAFLE